MKMNIDLKDTKLIFAHDVLISNIFRTEKTKRGTIKKEPFVELIFVDAIAKKAISRIMLPLRTLKTLPKLITDNLKRVNKELKNKEMPKQPKLETKNTNASYWG